jgi:hypothetical protein
MDDLTPEQQRRIDALLAPKRTIQVRNASDIEPRKSKFLWYPYFPLGKVVIVAGAPGHGKSQFAALAAGRGVAGLPPRRHQGAVARADDVRRGRPRGHGRARA